MCKYILEICPIPSEVTALENKSLDNSLRNNSSHQAKTSSVRRRKKGSKKCLISRNFRPKFFFCCLESYYSPNSCWEEGFLCRKKRILQKPPFKQTQWLWSCFHDFPLKSCVVVGMLFTHSMKLSFQHLFAKCNYHIALHLLSLMISIK